MFQPEKSSFEGDSFKRTKEEIKIMEDVRLIEADIAKNESKKVKNILKLTYELAQDLRETPEGQKNEERIKELAKNLNISENSLEKSYRQGLKSTIKTAIETKIINKKYPNPQLLKEIIGGFTLNFRSILRSFEKDTKKNLTTKPKNILKITKESYLFPPIPRIIPELKRLKKKYPEADRWIIKYAVIHHLDDSEKFIEKTLQTIERLNEEYPEVYKCFEWIIKHAVIYHSDDPKKFIEKAFQIILE